MVLKKKLKFFSKRFGSFKNLPYLCNRFPLQKREDGSRKKMLKFFFKKIWKFGKVALPLQPLSASKIGERNRDQKDFGLKIQFVL